MRILYWAEQYEPLIGGVETYARQLLQAMIHSGNSCALLTNGDRAALDDQQEDPMIFRLGIRRALASHNLKEIRASAEQISAIKRSFRPDVLHIHLSGPSPALHLYTRQAHSCPVVMTLHGPPASGQTASETIRALLATATALVPVSRFIQEEVCARFPELSQRMHLIPFGAPGEIGEPVPLPFDPPVVLCLGRLVRDKGFDLALHALAPVCAQFPALRILIAGDGPERSSLVELAAAMGLEERVEFLGWVAPEQIPALISRATLLLVPSRCAEAAGIVLIEAGQIGRPVVAAAMGGIPEIVRHGDTGLLVENGNVAQLSASIGTLLINPEHARAMGEAARCRIASLFNADNFIEAYQTLYQSLVKR